MTDLILNLVWMLQGLMNTLAALSSGEWLMLALFTGKRNAAIKGFE